MNETVDELRGDELPALHTGQVEGETIVGVLYIANTGEFYEFQSPDTHNHYALFVNPRTGDEMVYNNALDASVKTVMGGHIRASVPVERWTEFLEDYLAAPSEDIETWREYATPEDALRGIALDTRG